MSPARRLHCLALMATLRAVIATSLAIFTGCTDPVSSVPPVPIPPDFHFLWGPDLPDGNGMVTLYLPHTAFVAGSRITLDNATNGETTSATPSDDAVIAIRGDVGDHLVVSYVNFREGVPATAELDVVRPTIATIEGSSGAIVASEIATISGAGFSLAGTTIEVDGAVVATSSPSPATPQLVFTVPASLSVGTHVLRIAIAGVAPSTSSAAYVSEPVNFEVRAGLQ